MGKKTFVLSTACFFLIVLVLISGCGGKGTQSTSQTYPPLQLDTTQLFNYDLPGGSGSVVGNALPPWNSGEYNSHQLRMTGGCPPYEWKYQNPSGGSGPVAPGKTSGITLGGDGFVEGTADELPASTLHRQIYVKAIVTDSCNPPHSVELTLRLDIIDNRAEIARQVTEQHLQEVMDIIESVIAAEGGMPSGASISFSNAIIGEPTKIDGPQWSVPTRFDVSVTVTVADFSTTVSGYAKSEVIVDVKNKVVIDSRLIEFNVS